MTLEELKIGERAIIVNESLEKLPLKLVELGCFNGSLVEVIQFAPFKDPIYVNINDTYLAIRKETAHLIEVRPLEQEVVI